MKKFTSEIFGAFDRRWLFRSYFISLIFLGLSLSMFLTTNYDPDLAAPHGPPALPFLVGFCLVNTLLFPFAKLVWNNVRDFILGDTVLISSAMFLFMGKFFINGTLWSLAIFIAPIGIGYLWFRNR